MTRNVATLTAVLMLVTAPSAWAYLDPGSGSMLLQVVLGGLAAVGVAARLYWHRFKRWLGFSSNPRTGE